MRFLVVDDDKSWVNYHQNNIKQTIIDSEIIIKYSAQDAFEEILSHPPEYFDVILTDMQMEHVETEKFAGIWLIKKLLESKKCQNSKIVIISGVYNIKLIAEQLGVDYISKTSLIQSSLVFEYKLKEL